MVFLFFVFFLFFVIGLLLYDTRRYLLLALHPGAVGQICGHMVEVVTGRPAPKICLPLSHPRSDVQRVVTMSLWRISDPAVKYEAKNLRAVINKTVRMKKEGQMLTKKTWSDGHSAAAYYLGSEMVDQVGPAFWHGNTKKYLTGLTENELTSSTLIHLINSHWEGQNNERNPVIDLAFTAPKPVSVLAALTSEENRQRIVQVHVDAVCKTLDRIEADHAVAKMAKSTADKIMQQVDGRIRPISLHGGGRGKGAAKSKEKKPSSKEQVYLRTHNLLAAIFTHFCSRPTDGEPDPNLHTHCVIPRLTQRPDGEWVTIYLNMDTASTDLNSPYLEHLLEGLQRIGIPAYKDLSLDIAIDGIEQDLLDEFSRRSQKIGAMCEAISGSDHPPTPQEKRRAAIFTREQKGTTPWQERLPRWRQRALVTVAGDEIEALRGMLDDKVMQKIWGAFWTTLEKKPESSPANQVKSGVFPSS